MIKLKEIVLQRKGQRNPRWNYKLLNKLTPLLKKYENENNIEFNVDYYELPDNKDSADKNTHIQVLHLSLDGKFGQDAVSSFNEDNTNMSYDELKKNLDRKLIFLNKWKKGVGQA